MLLYHFCCVFFVYLRAISKYKSPGAYIRRGDLTEAFFALLIRGGANIWRGLYMEGLFFGILQHFLSLSVSMRRDVPEPPYSTPS